jgi:hypothetical protein
MSPNELSLTINSVSSRGHLAVHGSLGHHVVTETHSSGIQSPLALSSNLLNLKKQAMHMVAAPYVERLAAMTQPIGNFRFGSKAEVPLSVVLIRYAKPPISPDSPPHRRRPRAPSSMPTGGAAAVLSGWLFERLDVSQSRVPAVPQQCQAPGGSRRPCLPGGLEVKEGLATQALFPACRAEAAGKSSSA